VEEGKGGGGGGDLRAAGAAVDSHTPAVAEGPDVQAGVNPGLPGNLQQLPQLGVHDLGQHLDISRGRGVTSYSWSI